VRTVFWLSAVSASEGYDSPEVLQKHGPAAFARLGVMDHLLKLCTSDARFVSAFFVDKVQSAWRHRPD
jgi:hypothetical protein